MTCRHDRREAWDCACSGYAKPCCGAYDRNSRCLDCGETLKSKPTAPAPNPRAWAVATALAAEERLDWAAWARGETDDRYVCGTCGAELRLYGRCTQPAGRRVCGGQSRADHLPVPAPWDADAYRADAARRGVEPGPMPSLEYDNPTGYGWCVVSWALNSGGQRMFVQMLWCGRLLCTWTPDALQFVDDGCCHREHAAVFVGWATAAKRAMGT